MNAAMLSAGRRCTSMHGMSANSQTESKCSVMRHSAMLPTPALQKDNISFTVCSDSRPGGTSRHQLSWSRKSPGRRVFVSHTSGGPECFDRSMSLSRFRGRDESSSQNDGIVGSALRSLLASWGDR